MIKVIKGFERYVISEDGTVFDTKRKEVINKYWDKRDKIFKVVLRKENGRSYTIQLNTLLAKTFNLYNPHNNRIVGFIDNDKRNTHIGNLYYTNKNNKVNKWNTEPIYTISAYQELRDILNKMGNSEVDNNGVLKVVAKNISDKELEKVLKQLLDDEQTQNTINNIIMNSLKLNIQ